MQVFIEIASYEKKFTNYNNVTELTSLKALNCFALNKTE